MGLSFESFYYALSRRCFLMPGVKATSANNIPKPRSRIELGSGTLVVSGWTVRLTLSTSSCPVPLVKSRKRYPEGMLAPLW